MWTKWAPTVALLLLALGSGWLIRELDLAGAAADGNQRHTPDLYLDNFTTTTMDEFGRPRRRLQAVHMAHFPDTDTSELEQPYLVLYRPAGPPWHVKSERGWVSASGDVMLLLGRVHIWRNNDDGERDVDVRTRDLRVLPDSEYGETDKHAVIRTPSSESHGVGMRAFLNESRIELLSEVRTLYEKKLPQANENPND